ncbi:uncharacterized protein LOC131942682 [Physella acuta]|uniref:uncharacterized protein LOC131942682 n=1 Tax=Physella acuta TaxID=109671 RepID=UPI0027DD6CC3|nr:uncharacterized protein LOC131942682 [Physella acuta]
MSCSQTSQRSGQNVSIYSSRDETCNTDPPDQHHHHHRAPTPQGTISTEVSQTNLYDNYSLSQIDLNRKNITFSSDMNNFVSEEFLEYLNSLPSRGISKCNLQIPSVYAKLDRREYPPGPVRRLEPLGCGDGLLERSSSNRTCLVAYHPLLPTRVASPGHQSISITGRTVIPDIRGASQTRTRHQDVQYSICGRCRTGGVQHHGIVPQYLTSSYSTSPHCTSHYRAL